MKGKTITKIHKENDESIVFVCSDEAFEMYHMQDCCEYVRIHDIEGDLESFIGEKIIEFEDDESQEWPTDVEMDEYVESFTWTTFTIKTSSSVVKIRWLGESNGYYSESVYFGRTHVPIWTIANWDLPKELKLSKGSSEVDMSIAADWLEDNEKPVCQLLRKDLGQEK